MKLPSTLNYEQQHNFNFNMTDHGSDASKRLRATSTRTQQILDAKYEEANLSTFVHEIKHLNREKKHELLKLLKNMKPFLMEP